MNPYVLALQDPQAVLETVGGKGISLTRMILVGLPVPGGFHVTTAAYRHFVDANGLQEQIMAILAGLDPVATEALEKAAQQIGALFDAGRTPPEVEQAITDAYAEMHNAAVAVRSSATAEDLPGASFAGQQETYLNIQGNEPLLQAVKRCWASLWTARAISYRAKAGIDPTTVALAVVVQELVEADAAGILFTANPTSGSQSELVVNAAWGLGEAVVSGAVTPDTIAIVKKTGHIARRDIAEKQVMTVRTEHGTQEQPVPNQKKNRPALTGAQLAELARLGLRIETLYGMPMDVEWALAGGMFFIVQARPITTLPMQWPQPAKGWVYARGSLAEHTPSPVSPLFATLGLRLANQATQEMWDRIIGPASKNLIAGDGFYQPIYGYVYGGMHMDPKNMAGILKMSLSQIQPMLRGSVERWQAAREKLAEVVAAWETKAVDQLTSNQLLAGASEVFLASCRYFTDIQTTLPAASSSEVLFTRFYRSLIRRKGEPDASVFLLGLDTVALRAEKSLYDLAAWLRGQPDLLAYAQAAPVETLLADLRAGTPSRSLDPAAWAGWQERFAEHLQRFTRTAYEFDFANPTPSEAPGPLLEVIKAHLDERAANPYERQRAAVEKREQATQTILQRTGWPTKGWFRRLLRWAQHTAPMREDSIFDLGMGHALVRRMLLEIGQRLTDAGAIDQAEEIFWLEQEQVQQMIAALDRGEPLADAREQIHSRKAEWQAQQKLSPPVMLPERSGWSRMIHGAEAATQDGKLVLKGVGTSAGTVTAPARIINSPEDFGRLRQGDVLVAVTTTPAWTPLFALASAVVTDIGGPLSHSSIVAREYGIPAVMAARGATRLIPDGQVVTVDGSKGTVSVPTERPAPATP